MSKSYSIFIHYKQGDDLAHIQSQVPTTSEALQAWSDSLRAGADHVARLATAMKGYDIELHADTHHIGFDGKDEKAEKLLAALAAEEMITAEEYEDEDEDDFSEGGDESGDEEC